ncbi:hypothetical protein FQN54_001279 [Arachnomyces sp. PD_36]|nr:hypothetical protein FQN54_001279 [Arachnomyces sp. PD_36]
MKVRAAAAGIALALAAPALAAYNDSTTFPASLQPTQKVEDLCPAECTGPGIAEGSWSAITSLQELNRCPKPLIFDTSIRFPIEEPGRHTLFRACASTPNLEQLKTTDTPCAPESNRTSTNVDIQVGWTGGDDATASLSDFTQAAGDLQQNVVRDVSCGQTVLFAKSGNAVLGLYMGSEIDKASVGPIVEEFTNFVSKRSGDPLPSQISLQVCDPDGEISRTRIVGITASSSGDVHAVHKSLGQWSDAECLSGFEKTEVLKGRKITTIPAESVTSSLLGSFREVEAAADTCKAIEIGPDGRCDKLAERCGIDTDKLIEYNGGDESWCNLLIPGEPACCTEGEPPDPRPPPNEDGTCVSHTIQPDQLCEAIEKLYHLKKGDLDSFNVGKTWGWAGCRRIQPGQKICVSDGEPPMPAYIKDAECGPQVPGTKKPDNDTMIDNLNECPLNVCCNTWGHCGTDEGFCIDTSIENTPGTAEYGTNGCVSNCGLSIVNNNEPPAEFSRIAYFEAWNRERPCLHMDVTDIGDPHTHIHFSFGHITEDYEVSAQGSESQFKLLVDMKDIKRIMSFGGWAFSNDPATSHIIRNGVKSENRQKFADNIVKFVEDNGLDGVDFDWEYPGADDIPGSDPGTPEDGPNYLEFLKLVREGLGDDKVLAIAAPASYWYLKNFPIDEISDVVSYIVYMTYDLHGQWDVDNKFVSPGCPEGNCLRSHVNSTITNNALAMVTKAGVKANKIMVGVTSYGRSFKMADPGCKDPMCKYLGERNKSPAMPGQCTETGGYIADAETLQIEKDGNYTVERYWDEDSDSDIFIYNGDEWVGWMTEETKNRRLGSYKQLNFAGASDWAIDLQGDINSDDGETVYIGDKVYGDPQMYCEAPCTIVLAPSPLSSTTTISIPPYTTSLEAGTETVTVTITPEPITTTQIEFYNVPISSMGDETTEVQPYPSLTVEDATVTYTFENGEDTITSTRTVTLPPWPLITRGPPKEGDGDWDEPPKITGGEQWTPEPGPPPVTSSDLPSYTDWYDIPAKITPIPIKPDEPEPVPDDEGGPAIRVPCDMWFYNTCPDGGDDGWQWYIPPGILPPGPPPPGYVDPPEDWTVVGPLPPWPPITVGDDYVPTDIPPKPDPCETKSASICGTTTSYGSSEGPSTTITTSTTSWSTCLTIWGCQVTDTDGDTTTGDGCTLGRKRMTATTLPGPEFVTVVTTTEAGSSPTEVAEAGSGASDSLQDEPEPTAGAPRNEARQSDDDDCNVELEVIIYPKDMKDAGAIRDFLDGLEDEGDIVGYTEVRTKEEDITPFFYVEEFARAFKGPLLNTGKVYFIEELRVVTAGNARKLPKDNFSEQEATDSTADALMKREGTIISRTDDYSNALLSAPPYTEDFYGNEDFYGTDPDSGELAFLYHLDDSAGKGQKVYVLDEGRIDINHQAFDESSSITVLDVPDWDAGGGKDSKHGTAVASLVSGRYGVAPGAELVAVNSGWIPRSQALHHRFIHGLILVLDDLRAKPEYKGKAVINISWNIQWQDSAWDKTLQKVMEILVDDFQVVFVLSAGNTDVVQNAHDFSPVRLAESGKLFESSIIVGSTDPEGLETPSSSKYSDPSDTLKYITYAPGAGVMVANTDDGGYEIGGGTSYAAPKVAALVAYLRGLPSDWQGGLTDPSEVKNMIRALTRPLYAPEDGGDGGSGPSFIWNGQVLDESCLLDPDLKYNDKPVCPCHLKPSRARAVCDPDDGSGGGDGGDDGGSIGDLPVPGPITWGDGKPSPICTSNCGKACDGYWCNPQPTGTPPDYEDPDPPEEPEDPPEDPEDPDDPEDPPEEPELDTPDPSQNEKKCYDSGQKASYGKIEASAESFCESIEEDGPVLSNYSKTSKGQPNENYHFIQEFEVYEGCEWEYSYDECMRYLRVPIDSCDCSQKGDKQGGSVWNNCIYARIDPNYGE